jgi:hypothetical protein
MVSIYSLSRSFGIQALPRGVLSLFGPEAMASASGLHVEFIGGIGLKQFDRSQSKRLATPGLCRNRFDDLSTGPLIDDYRATRNSH